MLTILPLHPVQVEEQGQPNAHSALFTSLRILCIWNSNDTQSWFSWSLFLTNQCFDKTIFFAVPWTAIFLIQIYLKTWYGFLIQVNQNEIKYQLRVFGEFLSNGPGNPWRPHWLGLSPGQSIKIPLKSTLSFSFPLFQDHPNVQCSTPPCPSCCPNLISFCALPLCPLFLTFPSSCLAEKKSLVWVSTEWLGFSQG